MATGPLKRILLSAAGFALVIVGITLSLNFWPYTVVLFKGCIGEVLAIAGLVLLYTVR